MSRKIVAGNWKMNTTPTEGSALLRAIGEGLKGYKGPAEVAVCAPFTHLGLLSARNVAGIALGAQDCSRHARGAYTGEVSAEMIKACGGRYVIIGHSERRMYHKEDSAQLLGKIEQALAHELSVIFCVGEPENVRASGEEPAWHYVEGQLAPLQALSDRLSAHLIVAYEPIWAIGTGRTASAEDAGSMCSRVAKWLTRHMNPPADGIPVLYGGSCNAANAKELFAQPGISGGLIGGASLKADDFLAIINAF